MTAALNRATDAIESTIRSYIVPSVVVPGIAAPMHVGATMPELARAALSAALTDPDDPDWLARVIADAVTPDGMDSEELHGECDRPGGCYHHDIAAAVRAAILGGAS